MASLNQRTWVCASSGMWWRTGKQGVLQSMGLQRVGHDWVTKQWQQQMDCQPLWEMCEKCQKPSPLLPSPHVFPNVMGCFILFLPSLGSLEHWGAGLLGEESRKTADDARGWAGRGSRGFLLRKGWLCSAVSLLLAQRYVAESPGSVGWIFRGESGALGILAENRSLGIPNSSTGSWLLK